MLYLAGALGIHLNSPWAGWCFPENLSSRRLLISHYSLEYFHPIKVLIADPAKHLVPPTQKHFLSKIIHKRPLTAQVPMGTVGHPVLSVGCTVGLLILIGKFPAVREKVQYRKS
jgi:hypothetical protein